MAERGGSRGGFGTRGNNDGKLIHSCLCKTFLGRGGEGGRGRGEGG